MEMLPPAPVPPNVVVGATVVKRFPGYGERRGTIAEIDLDGGKVVVRWATDESTISLEAAAHAVNAAIRRAGLEGRRKMNPVVDGQLVPPARKRKYRSEDPAATPSPRARRR